MGTFTDHLLLTLAALTFLYLSYLLGEGGLRLLGIVFPSRRRLIYAVLLGYGTFALIGFGLAAVGIFRASVLIVFVSALLVGASPLIRHHLSALRGFLRPAAFSANVRRLLGDAPFLSALVFLWLLANFFIVFVPLTGHDTLDYHFPLIEHLLSRGDLHFASELGSYREIPVLGEIFYATTALIFGERDAPFVFQLIQYSFLLLFAALLYDLLRGYFTHRVFPLVSVLLLLSVMEVEREALHGGYVDMFAFLYGFGALFLILEAVSKRALNRPTLILSAILLGIGLGVKYTTIFFGAIIFIFLLFHFIRERERLGKAARAVGLYALPVVLVSGFWYLKNFILFGNPVYPMFTVSGFSESVGMFLVERTPLNFLVFPFVRWGQWFIEPNETSSRLVVLAYFLLLYLCIFLCLFLRQRLPRMFWLLFTFAHLYAAFLFVSSHQYRFLLPTVMVLPGMLVFLAQALLISVQRRRPSAVEILRSIARVVVPIAFIVLFLGNLHYFSIRFTYRLGYYTTPEYVQRIGSQ